MKYIRTTANNIELKYPLSSLTLVYEYIGPYRTHGDMYLDDSKYVWIECFTEINDLIYSNGRPVAILCLTENQHLPLSLHLSVIEVFQDVRKEGIGSIIMNDLISIAKSLNFKTMTLQVHTPSLKSYYARFGFKNRKIDGYQIMRKYL